MDSRYRILERLAFLHKTSRAVIRELENWGIKTTPSQFSDAVKGIIRYRKADDICETADKIITKWESQERYKERIADPEARERATTYHRE